jgi:hypothetical protein
MNTAATFIDPVAELASADFQKQTANMVQDAFAQVFRLSFSAEGESDELRQSALGEIHRLIRNWVAAAGTNDPAKVESAKGLRLALMISGLDQWGLAYAQAFELNAIPALTTLLGALRTGLDPQAEANFQQQFDRLAQDENAAIDFKIALRRAIHLALWHAMISCETLEEALALAKQLGSQKLVLIQSMPTLGWRLVADALAHIQLRCLNDGLAVDGIAQESNQALFTALGQALPKAEWDQIMAQSTQVVLAVQRAKAAN